MMKARKVITSVCAISLMLSGCVTPGGGGDAPGPALSVGPEFSSFFDQGPTVAEIEAQPRLDVIVPVFDPGIPEERDDDDPVWPELRRAEANRFAVMMKKALEETNRFGAVRVTPDATATGDLYVIGKIIESDGEDVEISIQVIDISGREWLDDSFDHEVEEAFYKEFRNKEKDPYEPVFAEAAQEIADELDDFRPKQLENMQQLTNLRFGANMTEEAFKEHLKLEDGLIGLKSLPADDDPMLQRVSAIRVRDQLFVDTLQTSYEDFSQQMEASYRVWQEQSALEIAAERERNLEAAGKVLLGILAIGLGVAVGVAGGRSGSSSGQAAATTGAVVAGVTGVNLIQGGFQSSEESKVHREALEELGESIDLELGPQVVKFEEETVELTGDAKEQFAEWREFLKKVFELERTPEKQL